MSRRGGGSSARGGAAREIAVVGATALVGPVDALHEAVDDLGPPPRHTPRRLPPRARAVPSRCTATLIEYASAGNNRRVHRATWKSLDILGITASWPPYLFFYALFIGVHLIGVDEALEVRFAITALAVVALVVFVLRTIPEFSAAFVVDGDIVELRPTTPTMVFR
jgi:hypothetical protein